jgi:hypothetical protein
MRTASLDLGAKMKTQWVIGAVMGAAALAAACGSDATSPAADAGSVLGADGSVQGAVDGSAGSAIDGAVLAQDGAVVTGGADASVSDASTGAADASTAPLDKFSFFVTSWAGMQRLSKSANGFGGDLRYGETGAGAGLRGADKICTELAESSMPGSGKKEWHAFLSTSSVNAKDRIGTGPWYDRRGRLVAMTLTDLLNQRPMGADSAIINDLPNEMGVPNHNPDSTGEVDNHDILTGTNDKGTVYSTDPACHCYEWEVAEGRGKPRVGHSWPRSGGGGFGGGGGGGSMNNWMSALDEAGCAPGASLVEMGPPNPLNPTVGSGGGYGGIYCFALTP